MPTPIRFGTDGWRALMSGEFTFENVRRVTQAVAIYWREAAARKGIVPRAVVGCDTRRQSDQFAVAASEVLAGNDITTICALQPAPTPAVSYAVKARGLIGGVMITASHNPPAFNGFKIKADFAGSADTAMTDEIERLLDREPPKTVPFEQARGEGRILVEDVRGPHREAVGRFVDLERIAGAKLNLVVDSMHGCGRREIEKILATRRGTAVTTLRAEPDPLFGGVNPEPIVANLSSLSDYLRGHRSDIALVTDGDADRIAAMDPQGEFISTHYCFAMLLLHLIRHRKQSGCVVKALNTTVMVDRICAKYGLALHETPVGFKWAAQKMRECDVLMGGEESGGLGFKGWIPERDGILAGLLLLEFLACERKPVRQIMAEMDAEFGASCYAREDVRYPLEKRAPLMEWLRQHPAQDLLGSPLSEVRDFDGVKMIARDGAWLMWRGSGTEPVLRVYAEAGEQSRANALVRLGRQLASNV
ncbi:MAG: phosphoglucomutase/phosphomannomutase family protein [Verrucomicrobia bacterium]|nr:phosphoglucomutase/phosphomannomutase family protein [Verrucomicrobiota bacterium]